MQTGKYLQALLLAALLAIGGSGVAQAQAKKISAEAAMAAVKKKVEPTYPLMAKNMGVEGVVEVNVTIGADGAVTEAKRESGHPVLSNAAVKAVKKWVFEPIGPATTTLSIEFSK